ncbi:putative methionyl-tRNA synthetase [Hordeum vulgare]|nr:putative methionyl-tRNA synthetase [Hordeum vulgare]
MEAPAAAAPPPAATPAALPAPPPRPPATAPARPPPPPPRTPRPSWPTWWQRPRSGPSGSGRASHRLLPPRPLPRPPQPPSRPPPLGKPFPFKHAWAILQTFDKWKLRDQETAPKKSAMLRMDDSEDEEKERNLGKPEGTKKGKQRTLETKILITEKKKEVKLAQVEAKREEAKRKANLEERMIKVKEAKVWKELMVEEMEHMMMSKKDMDQEQLQWWKDYKEDIAERKRIFRGASSTLRGDTPMSGGGDGGVDDSTTGDNGGA